MSIVLDGTSGLTSPAAVLTTTPLAVTSGGTGVTTSTGSGANVLGTSPTLTTPTFDSASLATISGTAPLYMCRAWVNFNGTGTVAIRASGNVSSITDNGTGDYTVNFTTAMVDANYSVIGTTGGYNGGSSSSSNATFRINSASGATYSTSAVKVTTGYADGNLTDYLYVDVAIFR